MSHPYSDWPYMSHNKHQLSDHGILDAFYVWGESDTHVDISCNSEQGCDIFTRVPKEFAEKVIDCRNRCVREMEKLFLEESRRLEEVGE